MGLITNFSSGELSSNLFGRIDLPQYHSGAARLENFDVIPTGGIKRRSGMERLAETAVKENVRLIPVIISREEKYLLLLTHEQIEVYKAGEYENPAWTFNNESVDPEKLYTKDEIHEVQYAQNQRTVIFAQQNHPPFCMNFHDEYVTINVFGIYTIVKYEHEPGMEHGFAPEEDKYYERGYLRKYGQYPRSVAFFNGRLVFAATEFDNQRLFFSHVNNFSDFSTYKTFVNQIKTITEVRCKITENSNKVEIVDSMEAGKVTAPDSKTYFVESRFFPKDTKLLIYPYGEDEKLYMEFDKPAGKVLDISLDDLIADLTAREEAFINLNNNPIMVGSLMRYTLTPWNIHGARDGYHYVNAYIGASYYVVVDDLGRSSGGITIPSDLIERLYNGADVNAELVATLRHAAYVIVNYWGGDGHLDLNFHVAASTIVNNSLQLLKYSYPGYEGIYYGYMPDIKKRLLNILKATTETYLTLFTLEFKKDDMVTPDCGFTFEVASGTNDAIRWLSVNRGIVVGTELSEFIIPPDIHAGNTQAIAVSRYGSDYIRGEAAGVSTVFFQSGRKGLVEYYPNEYDQFRANNMALLAQQMLHESPAKEFDFATAPYTRFFITREDGTVVTLLYERNTGTFAWNRITTGEVIRDTITPAEVENARKLKDKYRNSNPMHYDDSAFAPPKKLERFIAGEILTCAILPGDDGFDDVYMIVKRGGKFFLERLKEAGGVYLDSWREWKWENEAEKEELLDAYDIETAVIYDEAEVEVYKIFDPNVQLPAASEEGAKRWIGYPYKSLMKSMPVVKNAKMGAVNMSAIYIRVLDSYEPNIWGGEYAKSEFNKIVKNGVIKETNILSGQNTTLQFYITHDAPNRCCILSVYTEV